MKKIFVLILTVLIVVACFSACGMEKKYMCDATSGFYHTYGNIDKLDVGIYSVKYFRIKNGQETDFEAKWLIVEEDGNLILQDPLTNSWEYVK